MNYKVLDTNILLLDASNLVTLGQSGSVIVLPETVLDELDSKKSVQGELGFQAREFGRLLTRAKQLDIIHKEDLVITGFELDDVTIHVVSSKVYPDLGDSAPNIRNDRKIIEIAIQYSNIFTPDKVTFVSNDVMCRIRAGSFGLKTESIKILESFSFEFTKSMSVPESIFRTLHNTSILTIDPDHKLENFNYKFTDIESGQVKLATISPTGLIEVLGKDSEKALRQQDVNPLNSDQLLLSESIQDPLIDVVVVDSAAGTGKTITAFSNAMKLVKSNTPYHSIVYLRASVNDVPMEEEVGFLPGSDEKFAPYLHPVDDTLDFIARSRHKKKNNQKLEEYEEFISEKIEEMKKQYNIQAMTGLGLRGRTFPEGTILIVDEVQNYSQLSLQKVITRVAKGSKLLLIGSNNQIDNKFITKYNNGLASVLKDIITNRHPDVRARAITLNKIVRSPLAEWGEKLFTKGEDK